MNQHDRSNLEFLLQSDPLTLFNWMNTTSPDDIDYATELLNKYSQELDIRAALLAEPADNEYPEARSLINRIKESSRSS